jgi:hypothetical protein
MRELRRCPVCRGVAWRIEGDEGSWTSCGLDSSYDYLFEWEPKPLPQPWALVSDPETRAALETQLRTEVAEGHALFSKPVIAIARCGRCDEVLFSVEEDYGWFAQVHLTWRQAPEKPPWPWTERLSMPLADSLADHHH